MAYRSFKPYTPGRRQMTVSTFEEITATTPEKSLLAPVHSHGGRNGSGKMTVRHQGGGHKRQYRIIDFKRMKDNVPAKSLRSNTIRTAPAASLFCIMQMVKNATSSLRKDLKSAM